MDSISYSDLRSNLVKILDKVNEDHVPVLVTRQNGKHGCVHIMLLLSLIFGGTLSAWSQAVMLSGHLEGETAVGKTPELIWKFKRASDVEAFATSRWTCIAGFI